MKRNWKYYEGLLKHMAESMGLMIVSVPANRVVGATWHVAKKMKSRNVSRLTVSYFSPKELLDNFLNRYYVINAGIGKKVWNPFYGMSPEEAELRMAVAGA